MVIKINVTNKRAVLVGSPVIVCGNSGYTLEFTFDAEWSAESVRTARFVYVRDGSVQYQDVVFSGPTAQVPVLANVQEVRVGVFAGELRTSTPALIPCERSIRCGTGAPEDPTPSQYDQIMALLSEDVVPHAAQHRAGGSDPLTAADVGARPNTWTPTAADVGARPNTWMPTAADVGAVSITGDTMKGELCISYGTFPRMAIVAGNCLTSVEGSYNKSSIQNYNAKDDSSNRRIINLYNSSGQADIAKALELVEYKNNATAYYNILHTGSKPSGSYTGNGSAEYRTIETGGIGNCCVVYGGTNQAAYLTPIGAFFHSGGTMAFTSDVSFANGVIRLGNAYIINTANTTYNYQVL